MGTKVSVLTLNTHETATAANGTRDRALPCPGQSHLGHSSSLRMNEILPEAPHSSKRPLA